MQQVYYPWIPERYVEMSERVEEAPMGGVSEDEVWDALRTVIDPEAGMNIVELGLVYTVSVSEGMVRVDMTMTSPACPMGESIAADAEVAVRAVSGSLPVDVSLVWDPPWTPDRMSESARTFFGW